MNKAERLSLIRNSTTVSFLLPPHGQRAKLQAKGIHLAGNPGSTCNVKVEVRYFKMPKPTGRGFVSLGAMQQPKIPKWAQQPDAVKRITPSPKRRKKNPFSAIANQPASKLPLNGGLKGPSKCARLPRRED